MSASKYPHDKNKQRAYSLGFKAASDGEHGHSCPYKKALHRLWWMEGFQECEARKREAKAKR